MTGKRPFKWGRVQSGNSKYERALFGEDQTGRALAKEAALLRLRNQFLEQQNAELLDARTKMINHVADLRMQLDILRGECVSPRRSA